MARKLRIEYGGAIYHVINRGNYRRDLFETVGAAEAFLRVLFEATGRFGWKIHAYVLMCNHFHLAVETPQPNLVQGMHWMQSTLATRFNRFRKENGHLFQGRYKALVVQDMAALARLVDYIHLNPVRAKVVQAEQVKGYRWSSLIRFRNGPRNPAMTAVDWLRARGDWDDCATGWTEYVAYLESVGRDEAAWEREGLTGLSRGWAIGTSAWRKVQAEEFSQLAIAPGLLTEEVVELREAAWAKSLEAGLAARGKTRSDLDSMPRKQPWKIELAKSVRQESGAAIPWLTSQLKIARPATLRGYLHRYPEPNQQSTA